MGISTKKTSVDDFVVDKVFGNIDKPGIRLSEVTVGPLHVALWNNCHGLCLKMVI